MELSLDAIRERANSKCPSCNDTGRLVVAMRGEEIQTWDKEGRFQGAGGGIGIGTGGIGVMAGGMSGTYSESGEQGTVRSRSLDAPARKRVGKTATERYLQIFLLLILMVGLTKCAVSIVAPVGSPAAVTISESASPVARIEDAASSIIAIVPWMFGAIAVIGGLMALGALVTGGYGEDETQQRRVEEYNKRIFPKLQEAFQKLKYCDHCYTLFLPDGTIANGDEHGLRRIMDKVIEKSN